MKKCIVRALLAALLLGLLAGAQAEPTALDAFYALMAGEDGQAQAASGDDCLDRVMAGEFAAQPGDDAAGEHPGHGHAGESGEDDPFRLPAGQSEGWVLAFANIYRAFMTALIQQRTGQPLQKNYPGIDDGIAGVAFVEACVRSWQAQGEWTVPQITE